MAHLIATRQNIRILLPDIVIGGSRFKQVGYVVEQNWTQPRSTGEVSGVIVIEVVRHALDETQPDGLGVELVEFNPRQPVRLIGNNNTLLAADTGETVAQRTTETQQQWADLVQAKADELHPRPVILQGDGLELLRQQAVVTDDEIRRHLAAAPAYHFAPKNVQGQPITSL